MVLGRAEMWRLLVGCLSMVSAAAPVLKVALARLAELWSFRVVLGSLLVVL